MFETGSRWRLTNVGVRFVNAELLISGVSTAQEPAIASSETVWIVSADAGDPDVVDLALADPSEEWAVRTLRLSTWQAGQYLEAAPEEPVQESR